MSKELHSPEAVNVRVFPSDGAVSLQRFKSVTKSYFRGAAGAIIVYDVTSKESFSRKIAHQPPTA
jgi:hypothetical protein